MAAATARRRGGETARWRDDASATRSRLDRHAGTRPRLQKRGRPQAKRRSLEVQPFGGAGAITKCVVVGGEESFHRLVETVLLFARWCVGLDHLNVRRRVVREVVARLLATQGLLACLSDENTFNKHYEHCEAEVRRDAQQAV